MAMFLFIVNINLKYNFLCTNHIFMRTDFLSEQALLTQSLKEIEFPIVLEHIAQFALSELGKEIVLHIVPDYPLNWLIEEHNRIAEMRDLLAKNEVFPSEGISDIRPQLHKSLISGSFLTASELLDVYDALRACRLLSQYFTSKSEISPALAEFGKGFYENRFLEKHITDAIDDTGSIKDTASRELAEIRKNIVETSSRLRSRMNKLLAKVAEEDKVTDEFVTQRDGRFVLPMRASDKRSVPGIIHGMSNTGLTVFVEPTEIVEMNNQLSLLLSDERREMIRILTVLTAELSAEASLFLQSTEVLAHFDAMFAKASYALEKNGVKPHIISGPEIELYNVYHPLLQSQKSVKPIPLTIEFTSDKRGHLISGPNAGGKTVALKSIGLNIAMALSGIFPLGECRTGLKKIFSAIGDHQSIENNLSTFSSQIVTLKNILSNAASDSLILVDEICSGTDPQEGSALASGIIDFFIDKKSMFVVTTHQSTLKSYALNRPEILNASMEFDTEHLKPTYRFQSGIPGNSYAFVLAESIGMPQSVLNHAKTYLGDKHSELEKSIASLQIFKSQAEESLRIAHSERLAITTLKKDYEEKALEFKQKKSEYLQNAKQEAKEIVQKANALIEHTIKEIREQKRDINDIRKEFSAIKKEIEHAVKDNKDIIPADIGFAVGDAVMISDNQRDIGSIIIVDEATQSAIVEFNGIKFKTALYNLVKAKKSDQKKYQKSSGGILKLDAKTTIDIRGFRADEACKEVEKLISDALISNIAIVTIIHGKGTGALRQAIHSQLSQHPGVSSYRNGFIAEGGDGITVVEIA